MADEIVDTLHKMYRCNYRILDMKASEHTADILYNAKSTTQKLLEASLYFIRPNQDTAIFRYKPFLYFEHDSLYLKLMKKNIPFAEFILVAKQIYYGDNKLHTLAIHLLLEKVWKNITEHQRLTREIIRYY